MDDVSAKLCGVVYLQMMEREASIKFTRKETSQANAFLLPALYPRLNALPRRYGQNIKELLVSQPEKVSNGNRDNAA